MRHAARTYLATQVTTTSQGQVLIMLYDGAIKFLTQAKERMAVKDYAGKGKLISSAIDIINELASSLNAEKGGDLAANLHQLYFYCNKRLFMANSRMDPVPVDEVITILDGIRSAYAQIIDTPEAIAAMASAPPPAAKPMRAPVNTQAAPANAGPVPTTKVHNAYATQGARRAEGEGAAMPAPTNATPEMAPPAPAREPQIPVAAAMPEVAPMVFAPLEMESDSPPAPAISAAKRAATSALYRKFAS